MGPVSKIVVIVMLIALCAPVVTASYTAGQINTDFASGGSGGWTPAQWLGYRVIFDSLITEEPMVVYNDASYVFFDPITLDHPAGYSDVKQSGSGTYTVFTDSNGATTTGTTSYYLWWYPDFTGHTSVTINGYNSGSTDSKIYYTLSYGSNSSSDLSVSGVTGSWQTLTLPIPEEYRRPLSWIRFHIVGTGVGHYKDFEWYPADTMDDKYAGVTYNFLEVNADITANPTSGVLPITITFTDNSTGFPEEYPYPTYTIDFDDGYYASEERQYTGDHWFHQYNTAGTYNVTYQILYDGVYYNDTQQIVISDSNANYQVIVHALNTTPIDGANVSIWYDGYYQDSEGTSETGYAYFTVPFNRLINGTVTHPGYQQANFTQYINTWNTWTSVTLYTLNETQPENPITYGNYIIEFRDQGSNVILSGSVVTVSIYEDSGYTELYETGYTTSGIYTALVPMNTDYYYQAECGGYTDIQWSYNLTTTPTTHVRYFSNATVFSPNLRVWVYTTSGIPIDGALVAVDSDIDDGSHITNSSGVAVHYCDNLPYGSSRAYNVTVSRGGYTTQVIPITVSTQSPSITVYLASANITTTATPTAVYTSVVTPEWSGTNGQPGNFREVALNYTMTQLGLDQTSANVLLGLIIILMSAVFVGGCLAGFGSGEGAATGALIGGAFGAGAATLMGFMPIWFILVMIAIAAMIFFFMRGGGTGGG